MTPSTRAARTFQAAVCVLAGVAAASAQPAAPQTTSLSPEVLALACAPTVASGDDRPALRVTGGLDSFVRRIYSPGEQVTINAGSEDGIEVGQEFYVRRSQTSRSNAITRDMPPTVRTAGWVRVTAVDDRMSLASITYACDSIEADDYLEPFVLPQVPAVAAAKPRPERDNYGRVTVGSDMRRSFGEGDFFVLDRGSSDGVTPGAQFVVYRSLGQREGFLFELGEAVAVSVGPDAATLRVTRSRDAVSEGDLVAMRR